MENFVLPANVIGTITVRSINSIDKYYVGEASVAIEKIGGNELINICAYSYHYEVHNGEMVMISDVGIEIMQPITRNWIRRDAITVNFPRKIEQVCDNWENLYYGHYCQYEHLKITNWDISLLQCLDENSFKVHAKGYITSDIRKISENHYVDGSFLAKIDSRIRSRYNWNYSDNNPDAANGTAQK